MISLRIRIHGQHGYFDIILFDELSRITLLKTLENQPPNMSDDRLNFLLFRIVWIYSCFIMIIRRFTMDHEKQLIVPTTNGVLRIRSSVCCGYVYGSKSKPDGVPDKDLSPAKSEVCFCMLLYL
jgi:hypothetical protein